MSGERVGVGIIGLGLISRAHIRGYQQAEGDAKIVAVCDSNESICNSAATNLGARGYLRHTELLRDPEVQVVDITLPHNLHYQVAKVIRKQILGTPRLIRTLIYGSEVERLKEVSNWKGRTAGSCGGVIIDAGAHSFYLLKWLFGKIATVQATSAKLVEESEVEDHAIVTGRMKSGAIFSTEYTFTAELPWGERLEIYGSV